MPGEVYTVKYSNIEDVCLLRLFAIEDLHVSIDGKEILKGVNLTVNRGEVHALMGPNGSGKSTLANALMGHPRYQVTEGRVLLNGEDVLPLSADQRARRGMFLAFQYPLEIPGVKVRQLPAHGGEGRPKAQELCRHRVSQAALR